MIPPTTKPTTPRAGAVTPLAAPPWAARPSRTLRPVAIEDGYDSSGTYFGVGQPLFWCAYQNEGTGHDIDFVFRAFGWGDAKAYVLHEYPAAEFEEFKDVDAFWRNYPIFD